MKERICDCCGKVIIGCYKSLTIEKELTNGSDTHKYFLCSEVCISKKIEEVSKSDITTVMNKTFSIRHI